MDNTLTVLTNNGSGGFVLATTLSVGNGPDSVTAADVNGDGKVDLISANWGDNTLSVLTNATVFPMAAPIPAPAGLVGWWRAEGNANDSVGTNNGRAGSGCGFHERGSGPSLLFQRFQQLCQHTGFACCLALLFSNSITIELWLKANDTNANSDWQGIVTNGKWRLGNSGTTGEHGRLCSPAQAWQRRI